MWKKEQLALNATSLMGKYHKGNIILFNTMENT